MEELRAAVLSGDHARAAVLAAACPDLNAGDPAFHFGATPLLLAVGRGDREMIDVLLRAGADIQARSNWWAGSFGVLDDCDADLARFLIERGAKVDAHSAARLGMLDRLREIVAADPAAVRARGGDGQTPLHFASTVEIAEFLLDHGADANARDIDHESTPAQWMVKDRPEVARALVARGCETDLLLTAALGDLERVRRHLDRDPAAVETSVTEKWLPKRDPRAGGTIYIWTLGWNRTAHMIARERGYEDVLRLLMERSSPELRLAMACAVGDEALVDSLPRVPAEAQARRIADAAEDEAVDRVRLFLRAGWPVDARGQHNMTALQWAAFHGNLELTRLLIAAGGDVHAAGDDFNAPPLSAALYGSVHGWRRSTGDYAGVVEALLDAGVTPPADPKIASDAVRETLRRR